MAFNEILDEEAYSIGIAPETDINTVGTVWTGIEFVSCSVSYEAAQVDTKRSRRSRGAATKVLTGKVWPRISLRFPEVGQLAAYAYASDTPDFQAAMKLLDCLGGSSAIAYQASGMSPTDGNTVSLITTTGKVGCLVGGRESTGLVTAKGFVQSLSGAGPFAATLFEDLPAQPGTTIGRIPTVTKYPSTMAPTSYSLRICGEHASKEYRFLGCYLTKAKRSYDADWRPYWDVELISYGGEIDATSGGLLAVTETLTIEPLIARGGSRFVLASNLFTGFNDAAVDVDGTCDVRNVELNFDIAHQPSLCPTGRQGVKEVRCRQPDIQVSFAVPDISDFHVSSIPFGRTAWEEQGEVSFSCYQGDTPGRINCWNMPRGLIRGYPSPLFIEGGRYLQMTIAAGDYTGDGASTDAGNKVFRWSQG